MYADVDDPFQAICMSVCEPLNRVSCFSFLNIQHYHRFVIIQGLQEAITLKSELGLRCQHCQSG